MNTCIFTGRIASDIELMKTKSGKSVMRISLAVAKDKENTIFPVFIAWNKQAEYLQKYANKGMRCVIQASYDIRTVEKEGKKYNNHEFNIQSVQLIFDAKKDEAKKEEKDQMNITSDDLPF